MWTLKENFEGMNKSEIAELIKVKLLKLKSEIPELKTIEVGINGFFQEKNHDVVLITTFDNLESLKTYSAHLKHQEVVSFIKQVITGRAAVDFEA